VRVADDFSVNPHALFHQQQANLLTVEAGQVAEEAVDAHGSGSAKKGPRILLDWSGRCLQLRLDCAQRGHRQDALRSSSGNAWSIAGSMLTP
jgi:hypothetical protein